MTVPPKKKTTARLLPERSRFGGFSWGGMKKICRGKSWDMMGYDGIFWDIINGIEYGDI